MKENIKNLKPNQLIEDSSLFTKQHYCIIV